MLVGDHVDGWARSCRAHAGPDAFAQPVPYAQPVALTVSKHNWETVAVEREVARLTERVAELERERAATCTHPVSTRCLFFEGEWWWVCLGCSARRTHDQHRHDIAVTAVTEAASTLPV